MNFIKTIAHFSFFLCTIAFGNNIEHLLIKDDFNQNGVADRVIFSSYEISGFYLSKNGNKQVDTFFLKQGNRSIFFSKENNERQIYIKLSENVGFITVITFLKYENKVFRHLSSYAIPEKIYFSDDFLSSPLIEDPIKNHCDNNSVFSNKTLNDALSWSNELKNHSVSEAIKKVIDPSCKSILGDEYSKMEKQVISACSLDIGKPESNPLIKCLDESEKTKLLSSLYKLSLAESIFQSGFKITCKQSNETKPLASFSSSNNVINFFQTTPVSKNRNYKADFFHEMMHSSSVYSESDATNIVNKCLSDDTAQIATKMDTYIPLTTPSSPLTTNINNQNRKDGVEINVPSQLKEVSQTTIAAAINEGSKTLDSNFSMENSAQYESLAKASKATFKSFDPIMKAAYEAAVPTAFALGSLASGSSSSTSEASVAMPTVKVAATTTRSIASASSNSATSTSAVYDISSLPTSVMASEKGELGNGLTVKAAAINIKEGFARSSLSTETVAGGTSSGTNISGSGRSGYTPTTDQPDLRNNVPQLKAEEAFIKTLTTGKYSEVKARLTDPKNQRILEDKRIQYVARDKTLGSKKPVLILKDLGNKFSIVRVTIE